MIFKLFSSPACAPCKAFAPVYEQLIEEYPDVEFQKLDIEDSFAECRKYGVRSVPTVVIERDGQEPVVMSGSGLRDVDYWKKLFLDLG